MPNTMKYGWIFSLALVIGLSGCVSKKKYNDLSTLKNSTQDLLKAAKRDIRELEGENAELKQELADCEDAKSQLARDTTQLIQKQDELRGKLASLEASCDQLKGNYDQLKNRSTEKLRDMMDQLEGLQTDLREREARLAEVERRLQERDSVVNALRERISDALLGFKDKGLTVDVRNGKVYVSLSNKLLFASGSTRIDNQGKEALRGLAEALSEQDDISIMVEGHTDDVPVSNLGDIKDNWDLSVMRSTEVVRILVEAGLSPTRVIPSGRSEFLPKAEGKTTEARASNRRTEIIISPRLDELFDLINKQ